MIVVRPEDQDQAWIFMSIDRIDVTCAMNALGQLGAVRDDLSSAALRDCIGHGSNSCCSNALFDHGLVCVLIFSAMPEFVLRLAL